MSAFLTATAFLVLVAVAAYVIHRLGLQHADRIAAYRYSTPGPAAAAAARHSRTPHHGCASRPDRPARPRPHRRLGPRRRVPGACTRAPDRARSGRGPWTEASEDLEHLST